MKKTNMIDNVIGNILGKPRVRGGRKDWDGDGVPNKKDCQPRNIMRQDYIIKPVGNKYMIFDRDIGQFLVGYTFNTNEEASNFIRGL